MWLPTVRRTDLIGSCRVSRLLARNAALHTRTTADERSSFRPQTAMNISTVRFGNVAIEADDVLTFVDGLIGMEQCRRWALLADASNSALGWLQSLDRPDLALAVVSPRRFVPDYTLRVARRDIEPLALNDVNDAQVLVIVGQADDSLALNLKAPLVIHLEQRVGRQVVARDDHAVQHRLTAATTLRMTG